MATDSHDLTIDTAEGPVTAHAQMLKAASPAPWLEQLPKKNLVFPSFLLKTDFKDCQKPHPTGLNCIPMAPKPQFVLLFLTAPVFSRV